MINVENLDFTYQNSGKKAIENLKFTIEKGEIFGFLGPSGAGKTTTQRLIIGLLRGYNGSIEVFGKERNLYKGDYFERIGVAFDFPNLYTKLTGMENLKLISSYYKKEVNNIDELLDYVGLLKDKDQRVENYSKGMKMRLNFIRSIIHDPDLIFLDEPTSGLDPVNAKIIKDKILDMRSHGKTIFLTTHNMTVAEQLCDRVGFINEGKLTSIDSPKNLMINHGEPFVDVEFLKAERIFKERFSLKNLNQNEGFNRLLSKYEIVTIHSGEATLEDVFIKFTGRELI